MKYKYMNMFTGALYHTFWDALKGVFHDMIHFKGCRTIRMFHIKKGDY